MENEKSENQLNENSKGIRLFFILIVFFLIPTILLSIRAYYREYIPTRLICGTHMAGLGRAMMIYVNDFDSYPIPEKWCNLLMENGEVPIEIFHCKGAKEGQCNYALNKYLTELGEVTDPDIVVFFETTPGWNQVGGPEILTTQNHKGQGCNVVFLDGHTEFIKAEDISKLKWKPD